MDHQGDTDGAGKIAEIDHSPVAKQLKRRDLPLRPSHDDQVVAGEQLGSTHYDENQAEGEGETAEHLPGPNPSGFPLITRVKNIAPNAMNAPASTPSMTV